MFSTSLRSMSEGYFMLCYIVLCCIMLCKLSERHPVKIGKRRLVSEQQRFNFGCVQQLSWKHWSNMASVINIVTVNINLKFVIKQRIS